MRSQPTHEHDLIRATSPGVEPVVAMCRACGERFMRRDGEWVSIETPKPSAPGVLP